MKKAADDKLDGVVGILQKVLQACPPTHATLAGPDASYALQRNLTALQKRPI